MSAVGSLVRTGVGRSSSQLFPPWSEGNAVAENLGDDSENLCPVQWKGLFRQLTGDPHQQRITPKTKPMLINPLPPTHRQ